MIPLSIFIGKTHQKTVHLEIRILISLNLIYRSLHVKENVLDDIFLLIVSSIGTFNYYLAGFLCDLLSLLVPGITLAKILFLLFLKLRTQIFLENFLLPTM